MKSNGIGCKEWDPSGTWCFTNSSCTLEKTESERYEGFFWSTKVCEGGNPGTYLLAANIENKNAINTDVLMFGGCAVVTLIAIFWHAKRVQSTTKHFVNDNNFERHQRHANIFK